MPASGNPRAKLGHALRSIFATLKAHKVVFINPTARIEVGSFARRIPLPAEPAQLRAALNSAHPASAAVAALVIFHGLRPAELRALQLTDVRDGRLYLTDRTLPLAEPVKTRLAAYLTYRHSSWPGSVNPHFFIHRVSAGTTGPAAGHWINRNLGMSAQAARQDRIIDEAQATAGDLRRICDFFGVTMATAEYYASTLNHPGLNNSKMPNADTGSTTQGQD